LGATRQCASGKSGCRSLCRETAVHYVLSHTGVWCRGGMLNTCRASAAAASGMPGSSSTASRPGRACLRGTCRGARQAVLVVAGRGRRARPAEEVEHLDGVLGSNDVGVACPVPRREVLFWVGGLREQAGHPVHAPAPGRLEFIEGLPRLAHGAEVGAHELSRRCGHDRRLGICKLIASARRRRRSTGNSCTPGVGDQRAPAGCGRRRSGPVGRAAPMPRFRR
jgi:hypothetical protein